MECRVVTFIKLHRQANDLSGKIFGRLTILGPVRTPPLVWLCRCECGQEKEVYGTNLKEGRTMSCGCLNIEMVIDRGHLNARHGRSRTSEYKTWQSIWQRCSNSGDKDFGNYGGRGIRVCDRWSVFEAFFDDMGMKPSRQHSIERINNNGRYEPGNCKWATTGEQSRNRRTTVRIEAFGRTGCLAEFFEAGSSSNEYQKARKKIANGWNAEQAINYALGS